MTDMHHDILRLAFNRVAVVTLAMLTLSACGKKPSPAPPSDPAPAPVSLENITEKGDSQAPPPPAPGPAAEAAAPVPAEQPAREEDPVTKLNRMDLENLNRGLREFVAKNGRLPKDFNELARSIPSVPLPPEKKMWTIDPQTKTIKAVSPK